MKKVLKVLFIFICTMVCVSNVFAFDLKTLDNDKFSQEKISNTYSFTPRIVKDKDGNSVTSVHKEYPNTRPCDETWCNDNHQDDYIVTEGSDYSGIYALYKNVGTYKGKIVDLKITVASIDFRETYKGDTETAQEDGMKKALLHFSGAKTEIGIAAYGAESIDFKIQYLEHNTEKNMEENFKSIITFADIDGSRGSNPERIGFKKDDVDRVYISNYGKLHLDTTDSDSERQKFKGSLKWSGRCGEETGDNTYSNDGDVNCSLLVNDDKIYGYIADSETTLVDGLDKFNTEKDNISKGGMIIALFKKPEFEINWNNYYISLTSTGFLEIDEVEPVKSVDKAEAKIGETVNYEIIQEVPNQSVDWYYNTWSIEDTIPSQLDVTAEGVKVLNEAGSDITSDFDIVVSDNKLVVSAKSNLLTQSKFYNTSYKIQVQTTVNKNARKDEILTNKAIHKYSNSNQLDSYTKESNEVTTKILVDEEVSVPSTSSTISMILIGCGVALLIIGVYVYFKVSKERNNL